MPTKKLTDRFVERVKPPPPIPAWRSASPRTPPRAGVCSIASTAGRFRLGGYPAIKLAQARKEAEEALRRVRSGIDPAAAKKTQRNMPPSQAPDVIDVIDRGSGQSHHRPIAGECARAAVRSP